VKKSRRWSCDFLCLAHRLETKGAVKPGGIDLIVDYLLKRGQRVAMLENPLNGRGETRLLLREGEASRTLARRRLPGAGPMRWFLETLVTPNLVNGHLQGDFTVICADPLNFAAAGPLLHPGRRGILLVVDYTPRRFEARWLNAAYQRTFRSALGKAAQVWAASAPAAELCRELTGEPQKVFWLPNSPFLADFPRVSPGQRDPADLVLVGHLNASTDLETVAGGMAALAGNVPRINLTVIGPGVRREEAFAEAGVGDRVRYLGQLARSEARVAMSRAGLGLAFYGGDPDLDAYRDSLKIREYAAAGLPIIGDGITPTAREGRRVGACFPAETPEEMAKTVKNFLDDPDLYREASENALAWAREMDKERILSGLLAQLEESPCAE